MTARQKALLTYWQTKLKMGEVGMAQYSRIKAAILADKL